MATYSTDLTTLTTAEAGTWVDFDAPYNSGNPGLSEENFIQGTDCFAVNTGKSVGLEISVVFDNGSPYSFGADAVVFAWLFYSVGTNLETYANSGWRFGIGSGTGTWDWFRIGGSDYGRNPYGGWFNVAIDPTATETGTIGGGNGGSYQYFGNVPYTLAEITKGDPVASDAIREGRGVISVTGSGGSFFELASYNDYNAGGTPPGTSSTSIDTGRHRLGLFQESGGTYVWKGILSLGTSGSSATFTDSNETIIIDDCPHTYPSFNKVEVHNVSSDVTLTNITFISTATTANGLGDFEVLNDATLALDGCSFNSMGIFTFDSNSTVTSSTFNQCGQIFQNEASMVGCSILLSAAKDFNAALIYDNATDTDGVLDDMTFSAGVKEHYAIDFGEAVTSDITLRGIEFTGFSDSNPSAASIVRFLAKSGSLQLNLVDCTVDGGAASVDNFFVETAGIFVTLSINPVTALVHVVDNDADPLLNARVYMRAFDNSGDLPYLESVDSITRSGTVATVTHIAHGLISTNKVVFQGITDKVGDNYGAREVTVLSDNSYTYVTTDEGSVSYTGTITATGVFIDGLTDSNGDISNSRTFVLSQPITGFVRKSTDPPRFKSFTLGGTIDNGTGLTINVRMILDE
jgi:hypothetical protein